MAANADAYRTLGLAPGASLDEVKRAYRRLAKANHPDAAGEAALPRFLAIQAAYDRIVDPDGASTTSAAAPTPPWEADTERARATHRAYGGRARRTRSSRTGTNGRTGPTGAAAGTGSENTAGAGPTAGSSGPADEAPPRGSRPPRPPKKATLGSTSYDGVEAEPFEPGWAGASWYGTTSGTYWTLNPKEYADPRKHGPEYQARARRAAEAAVIAGTAGTDASGEAAAAPSAAPETPTHTTATWWAATDAGPAETPDPTPDEAADATAAEATAADEAAASMPPDPAPDSLAEATWLDVGSGTLVGRVGRAVVGWAPIALGIGWLVGEISGCGRFAATCDPAAPPLMLVAQLAVLAVLLLVPRLASVALVAAVTTLAAAIPGALVLASMGGATDPGSSRAALAVVLVTGWLAGLGLGLLREGRRARPVDRPVS